MEEKSQQIYYIPVNGENIQISKEDFLKRFPTERQYYEYLMRQDGWETNKITGNEITPTEFLKLAQFIYDDPEMDSIPMLDIGLKIYSLNAKIKYGIETSQMACKELKEYKPEIPCPPYPEKVFWAKLQGVKPLQFLEPSFDAKVSIDDVIKFSIAAKQEINGTWDKYLPLLNKPVQKGQNPNTISIDVEKKAVAIDFKDIMKGKACSIFAEYENKPAMQVFIQQWGNGEDKVGLCGLIYHLFDQSFLYNSKGRQTKQAVINAAKRLLQDRYNTDLKDIFRTKEGRNPANKTPFLNLKLR
jgi:hypothetical protein